MSPSCKKKKIVLSRNRKTQPSDTTRPDSIAPKAGGQLSTVTPRQQRMEAILRRENNSLEIYEAEPRASHLLFTDVEEEKSRQDESEPERLTTRPFNETNTQQDSITPHEIVVKGPLLSTNLNEKNEPLSEKSQFSPFKPYQCCPPARTTKSFLSVTLKDSGQGTSRPQPKQKRSIHVHSRDPRPNHFTRAITESAKNTIFVSFIKRSPSTAALSTHKISSERYKQMGETSRYKSQSRLRSCNSIKLIKQL